ncbi:hypothetical protein [Alienimonas californiensis]|uniref:Uncharacterized protein n=1 Tax=Alienimonas californiensis TaxID=2527989 RepID=A0A517P8E3_9PLAN|nr:hypothetical protein [Alienimonas californiensis]QDT15625.1 hypothetical protein CA12_17100 [Alienimonas californiensis]
MRFQLTPLLDLLLIVVFAQFLEGKQADQARDERAEAQIEAKLEELDADRVELTELRETLNERNARLEEERNRAVELARSAVRTAQDMEAATNRSADLLTELLDVPEAIASQLTPEPRSDAEQDLESARQRIAQLRDQKGFEVLRFLAGYEELLKRAEIWTLHVRGGGFVALSTGSNVELIRLEADGQRERAEEFVRKLFAATKILPQPKGLVVILVSFDRTARAGVYQPVLDGLGEAVRRLEVDQGGRTQYEFAVLGAAPEPAATQGTPDSAAGPGDAAEPPAEGGTLKEPPAAPSVPSQEPNP